MSQPDTPPLVRHPSLQPLSRDHYVGLVQSQRLIKAAAGTAIAQHEALAAFLDAWDQEIDEHFRDEERLLPELMTQADTDRMLREHATMRAYVAEAREHRRDVDPPAEFMRRTGQFLNDHIRWEERQAFQAIQANASEAQLEALGHATAEIEWRRPRGRRKRAGGSGEA